MVTTIRRSEGKIQAMLSQSYFTLTGHAAKPAMHSTWRTTSRPFRCSEFMKRFAPRTRLRRWQWTAVGFMCAVVGVYLLFCRATPPARFIVLGQPFEAPLSARDRFESYLPRSAGWAWMWGVEQTLLGKRAPVNVSAEVISLTDSSPALLSSLALGPASFSTNGLEIWLLEAKPLKALRERFKSVGGLEVLSRPRISTADGIGCTMFQGSIAGGAQVGLE